MKTGPGSDVVAVGLAVFLCSGGNVVLVLLRLYFSGVVFMVLMLWLWCFGGAVVVTF